MMQADAAQRPRLNRARVLRTAVALADQIDIGSLSMRRLAQELDVTPMALYKHVADKEALLDGMVEVIVEEIDAPLEGAGWKATVRHRVLSSRRALQRHVWARRVIESRTTMTAPVLRYLDSVAAAFLAGGFSADLTHHVMHALGGRVWGFTQELFDESRAPASTTTDVSPEQKAAMLGQMAQHYPSLVLMASSAAHTDAVVGHGCDDDFEFAFTLDVMLDGFERLHARGWNSAAALAAASAENRAP
jgi:AcrR family transcriptional regulator